MTIYYGCALSDGKSISDEAIEIRQYLEQLLGSDNVVPLSSGKKDWRTLETVWADAETKDGRVPNVHARDFECLDRSEALIGYLDRASTGFGRELEYMLNTRVKPALVLSPDPIKSRLVSHDTHPLLYRTITRDTDYKTAIREFARESKVPGPIIVLAGGDGIGKATTTALLRNRLRLEGYTLSGIDFPRRKFRYGPGLDIADRIYSHHLKIPLDQANPWIIAGEFARDRACCVGFLNHWQRKGNITLLDRYLEANWAHQGALLADSQLDEFIAHMKHFEHEINGIPRPDLTIYYDLPVHQAVKAMVDAGRQLDEQEKHISHMTRVRRIYQHLADHEPSSVAINMMDGSRRKSPEEIVEETYIAIAPLLVPFRV